MKPIVEYQSCPFCKGVLKLQRVDGRLISATTASNMSKERELALRLAGTYIDAVCFNCAMEESEKINKKRFSGLYSSVKAAP